MQASCGCGRIAIGLPTVQAAGPTARFGPVSATAEPIGSVASAWSIRVTDCRDAKDNRYLELALAAGADAIISGDADLLVLHPWRGTRILRPADYLAETRLLTEAPDLEVPDLRSFLARVGIGAGS